MDDEKLGTHLNEWVNGERRLEPLNSIDLASRVRDLRSTRANRRRTVLMASLVVVATIGMSASYFNLGNQRGPDIAMQVTRNEDPRGPKLDAEEEQSRRSTELSADLERTQFHLDLLAMNIRIQQQIASANRLTRECERLSSKEQQASQWLAATFQEISGRGSSK